MWLPEMRNFFNFHACRIFVACSLKRCCMNSDMPYGLSILIRFNASAQNNRYILKTMFPMYFKTPSFALFRKNSLILKFRLVYPFSIMYLCIYLIVNLCSQFPSMNNTAVSANWILFYFAVFPILSLIIFLSSVFFIKVEILREIYVGFYFSYFLLR